MLKLPMVNVLFSLFLLLLSSISFLDSNTAPRGASVPSLGLSNKAVYENSNENGIVKNSKDPYPEESHFVATELTGVYALFKKLHQIFLTLLII